MRAVLVMVAGGAVAVIGSLLPWVRTGARHRNSYDLLALVERLGFSPDGPAATALRWWPALPLLVTAAAVGAWWWPRAGGLVGAFAAIYAGATGVAVSTAPASSLVDVQAGPVVTTAGAVILLAGSVVAIVRP